MGMTTERLLVMVLILNFVMGLSAQIYANPTSLSYSDADNDLSFGESLKDSFEGEASSETQSPENLLEESTIGSTLSMSKNILRIFLWGFTPYFLDGDLWDVGEPLLQPIIYAMMMIQMLMYILIILEGYRLFKNKKT